MAPISVLTIVQAASPFRSNNFNGTEDAAFFSPPVTVPSGSWVFVSLWSPNGGGGQLSSMVTTVRLSGVTGSNLSYMGGGAVIHNSVTSTESPIVYGGQYKGAAASIRGVQVTWTNSTGAGGALYVNAIVTSGSSGIGNARDATTMREISGSGLVDGGFLTQTNVDVAASYLAGNGVVTTVSGYPAAFPATTGLYPGAPVYLYYPGPGLNGLFRVQSIDSVNKTFTVRSSFDNGNASTFYTGDLETPYPLSTSNSFLSVVNNSYNAPTYTNYGNDQPFLACVYISGSSANGNQTTYTNTTVGVLFRKFVTTAVTSFSGNDGTYDVYYVTTPGLATGSVLVSGIIAFTNTSARALAINASGIAVITYSGTTTVGTSGTLNNSYIRVPTGDTTYSNFTFPASGIVLGTSSALNAPYPMSNAPLASSFKLDISTPGVTLATGVGYQNLGYTLSTIGSGSLRGMWGLMLGTTTQSVPSGVIAIGQYLNGQYTDTTAGSITTFAPANGQLLSSYKFPVQSSSSTDVKKVQKLVRALQSYYVKIGPKQVSKLARAVATRSLLVTKRITKSALVVASNLVRTSKTRLRAVTIALVNVVKSPRKSLSKLIRVTSSSVIKLSKSTLKLVRVTKSNSIKNQKRVSKNIFIALARSVKVLRPATFRRRSQVTQAVSVTVIKRKRTSRGVVVSSSYTIQSTKFRTFTRRVIAASSQFISTTRIRARSILIVSTVNVLLAKTRTINIIIPAQATWNMTKNGSIRLLVAAKTLVSNIINIVSNDWQQPNNGQPLEGNETEIFDDVPEIINEIDDGLGTDIVPFHE